MFTETMSLGEKLFNGLGITILGVGVVFAVLVVLSYALDILRMFAGENNKKKATPSEEAIKESTSKAEPIVEEKADNDELIAVLAAAIAAISGSSVEDFMVRSIKSVPQKNSAWASVGRQQQML